MGNTLHFQGDEIAVELGIPSRAERDWTDEEIEIMLNQDFSGGNVLLSFIAHASEFLPDFVGLLLAEQPAANAPTRFHFLVCAGTSSPCRMSDAGQRGFG